jgi:hypothetical protein
MHFGIKNYLKNNHNHTTKYILKKKLGLTGRLLQFYCSGRVRERKMKDFENDYVVGI